MRALHIAATGMQVQQTNIDNISNNLANVNTTGFKAGRADFQDLLYQSLRKAGAAASSTTEVPSGIYLGYGARVTSVSKNFEQGAYEVTGEELDMLIEGEGFYEITLPDGSLGYSRDGSFQLDSQGRVVTSDGNPLSPQITIPSDVEEISIAEDGTVSVVQDGTTSQVGQITIARFANKGGLEPIGSNLFRETDSSGTVQTGTPGNAGYGSILQGSLERSNVSMVDELVGMIVGQRSYEINSKAITTADEMMSTASSLKR